MPKLLLPSLAMSTICLLSLGCSSTNKEPRPNGVTQNLPRSSAAVTYHVDIIGPVANPLKSTSVEIPSKDMPVVGWAIDDSKKKAAGNVDIVLDHVPWAAHYGVARKDVATFFKEPAYDNSGFEYTVPASQLTKGVHVFAIRVVANDGKTYSESPEVTLVVQ